MTSVKQKVKFSGLLILLFTLLLVNTVFAHERRDIDKYQFIVGFFVEPAYEGLKNGVDFRVSIPAEEEGGEATPVEGLEETLQVEITHVASEVSKTMPLRTIFREPGHYTADLIPTAPGQYRMRFFGTIDGLEVDETFESGPGRFGDIQSSTNLQFPETLPEVREIEGVVRGMQETSQNAQESAASGRTLAIVGIILGIIGTASGLGAIAMSRRA